MLDKNIKEIHLWNCQPENLYRQRAQLEGSVEKVYIAFHDKKIITLELSIHFFIAVVDVVVVNIVAPKKIYPLNP